MSSILTNTSAMVALQTLKSINSGLSKVQSEISTGKTVSTARDNAAVWSISKVMESDVQGFKGISDSLALGSSTLTVAREASEKIQGLLTNIKTKVVSAQSENVPREKLQTDIDALKNQISGIVSAAQFGGLNLISGSDDVKFLASLNRSDAGISVTDINVARQDLGTAAGIYGGTTSLNANVVRVDNATDVSATGNTAVVTLGAANWATSSAQLTIGGTVVTYTATAGATDNSVALHFASAINALGLTGVSVADPGSTGVLTITSTRGFEGLAVKTEITGGTATMNITAVNGAAPSGTNTSSSSTISQRAEQLLFSGSAAVNDGDGYRVAIGGQSFSYIAGKNETMEDVARGLKIAVDAGNLKGIATRVVEQPNGQWALSIDNNGSGSSTLSLNAVGNAGGKASGGLFGLDSIDVTTADGARKALENVETLINRSINAAAEFGSAQGRMDIQRGFVTALTDALTSGIGTLIDADMEEASARLQALQVQQQLGIQALSIANQQPQNLLALFR